MEYESLTFLDSELITLRDLTSAFARFSAAVAVEPPVKHGNDGL